jgi:parallel beta-helix repeat protein
MTTYYVSSIIGSDKNAGTSATAPLASLQEAESLVRPGDVVEVMNGTYTGPGGGNVLTITTSGTASAPITFEAAPGATPIIDSSGTWQGIEIEANYITINGLTVVGDAANYTLAQALAGESTGDPSLDGNGIAVAANAQTSHFHNIIIENNTIYNEPGGGIAVIGADYVQILNNNVHDNAHWSAFGASGISIYKSVNSDNAPGPHIIVEGNTSVNNAELVPVGSPTGTITDGEGIILDTNTGYTGGFLIENNITHGNSGPGIEAFLSDNTVITGNTTTGDLTNAGLVSEGEIFNNESNNVTITNNVTTVPPPPPPPGELVVNGSFETHDFSGWTVGGNSGVVSAGPQVFITSSPVEDGSYAVAMGSLNTDGTLTQTLASKAGESYTLSFWLANNGAGSNDFSVQWDGHALMALTNAATQGYTHYTYQVTGTGSDTLRFSAFNDPGAWYLDNVQVTDNGTSASKPPPPPPTGNLVANPGFETGDFSGWTLSGNVAPLSVGPQAFITTAAHSGSDAAGFGSVGSDGILSQNLTTVAGQSYTFDFWLANVGGNPNDFAAKIGGITEMHLVNQPAQGYTHYVFDFTATGSTTPIEFDFRQDPSEWHLDDVSVVSGAAVRGLTVVGTSGSDTLANPTGTTSDTLIGNGGIDTFVFHGAAFGNDTIADFSTGTNHDIIQFDHTVFSKFSAIKAHAAQVGSNTVITVDAHDSVTLLGVSLSHLQASDFHFV